MRKSVEIQTEDKVRHLKYGMNALINLEQYTKRRKRQKEKIHFYLGTAETYSIKKEENYFYFFNPFSIQIFQKIIRNIMYSLEKDNREVKLILYFPSDEYRFFMENHPSFSKVGEVQVGKNREKDQFIIYKSVY